MKYATITEKIARIKVGIKVEFPKLIDFGEYPLAIHDSVRSGVYRVVSSIPDKIWVTVNNTTKLMMNTIKFFIISPPSLDYIYGWFLIKFQKIQYLIEPIT